jgi:hypothetical protein
MSAQRRGATPLLLAGVVLLGGVVLYRNFFSNTASAAEEADAAPTPRERYLEELSLSRRQQALADQAEQWNAALERARGAWDSASREMVRGRTLELAEAGFRERVLAEVKDLKFSDSSANTQRVEAPAAAAPLPVAPASGTASVRTIGLKVDVRTDSPAEVYRLIDRLENMPDARAGVVSVELRGPGLAQTPGEVNASITVQALALIGESMP